MKKSEDGMLLADPRTLVGDALVGWMERARAAEAEAASLKQEMEEKDAHTRKQWSVAQFPVADYIDAESAVSVMAQRVAALRAQLEAKVQ